VTEPRGRLPDPESPLLDTLRIKFGRIDSSEAPNTANDRADQLALSAAWADGLSLRKPLVPGLLL
jgi:hypothetical protein